MKRVRKYFVEIFGFSQRESKGFLVFLVLVLIFFGLSNYLPSILFQTDFVTSHNSSKIQAFLGDSVSEKHKVKAEKSENVNIADPNTMSFFDWTSLGVDQYLADRIISYRLKGGQFKKKEDLKKIYGLNDSIYLEISQFLKVIQSGKAQIKYADVSKKQKLYKKREDYNGLKKSKILPELNTCDSTDLLFIRGIGPARAARIIKYRMKLGGFQSKDQLSEIYGLDSLVLASLISNTVLKKEIRLNRIDINKVSFKELISHPYVDYNTCKVVLNFRKQHGKFSQIEDLKKIKIIDSLFIRKMEPYLEFL